MLQQGFLRIEILHFGFLFVIFDGDQPSLKLSDRNFWEFYCYLQRSSLWQMFFKIGVLKYFVIFTRKHLCWSLFLIKLQAWRPTQVFSCEYCEICKNSFLTEHLLWLLLFTVSIRFRSSHPEVFLRKGVPKIYNKFTREHPCRSLISIKLLCNFIEIALQHGCSPVNLLHIFRSTFSLEHLWVASSDVYITQRQSYWPECSIIFQAH